MRQSYTIGELSKEANVPTSTIRYYERAGILRPSGRSAGNYRVYSASELCGLLAHAAGLLDRVEPVRPIELVAEFAWERVGTADRVVRWTGSALELLP